MRKYLLNTNTYIRTQILFELWPSRKWQPVLLTDSMKKILVLISLLFLLCNFSKSQDTDVKNKSKEKPFLLGIIDTIQSSLLSETRAINIYLPEGYSPDSASTYPVIYLLDGGGDEDFIHIVGLVRYFNQPWINRFPKSIVVGIASVNRRKDFTFATPNLDFVGRMGFDKSAFTSYGGSEKFISFIEKELQPFIEKNCKTNLSKTIIGESLGGLLATEILLKKPKLFNTYIIISPSLWWGKESLLKEAPQLLKTNSEHKIKVYVGAANKEESIIMYDDAKELEQTLKKYGGDKVEVSFDYLSNETHATIIHQAVYNAFKLLYPAK